MSAPGHSAGRTRDDALATFPVAQSWRRVADRDGRSAAAMRMSVEAEHDYAAR
jgi:hypothetical protein